MSEKLSSRVENPARFNFPDLQKEIGEIERVASEYFPEVEGVRFTQEFMTRAKTSKLELLSEADWATLQNTDSYDIAVGDWNKVEEHAEAYEPVRDWAGLRSKIGTATAIDAPIIVRKAGNLYLVSGNTRLMVTRAFERTPQVLIVDMTDYA